MPRILPCLAALLRLSLIHISMCIRDRCAKAFEKLGFDVCPKAEEKRSDIIEAVKLGSPEAVVAFCEGIQAAAPIDAYVKPVPWDMPGYEDQVVMAAGAFVPVSYTHLDVYKRQI